MTLDEYQKRISSLAKKLKDESMEVLQEGIKSGLDGHIMIAIFEREFTKIMEVKDA